MSLYLDNAATTKPYTQIIEAMIPYLSGDKWHNPSALYNPAKIVKRDIQSARETIADYINADADEIIFTSGGSESNCLAIEGFIKQCILDDKKCNIITTPIEHNSIISCINELECTFESVACNYIPIGKDGLVLLNRLEETLRLLSTMYNKCIVSIQFANNEIGTIQDIKTISNIVHRYNALLHVDAVQAFGQVPIDVKELGVDMMSVSGHKVHTPKGIGFLYKKNGVEIRPIIYGTQENGMRGGTENVPYIMGLKAAVERLKMCNHNDGIKIWRDDFIKELESIGCIVNGSKTKRLPNNINVTLPNNVTGEALIYMLDMCGVYISAGSACNSYSTRLSHVLESIGLSEEDIIRTIRITLPDIPIEEREHATSLFIDELNKQIKILDTESY